MPDIDFDALMPLPNLLENGDFLAGNDDSEGRTPGWENTGRITYGQDYWLDYSPKQGKKPWLCVQESSRFNISHMLYQRVETIPSHQYALIATMEPERYNPNITQWPVRMNITEEDGTNHYPALNPVQRNAHRIAVMSRTAVRPASIRVMAIQANPAEERDTVGRIWVRNLRLVDLTAAGMDEMSDSEESFTETSPWEITGPDDAGVHNFTRDWWDTLPRFIRDADQQQAPIPVPLLRYLDGAGKQAGAIRDTNNGLWDGTALDPDTAPDHILPWIAYLLGLPPAQQQLRPSRLRRLLREQTTDGSPGVGTREHITSVARAHLNPGAQIQVLASSTLPWTLIIGVQTEDIPDGNHHTLERQLRDAGVIPAGHTIRAQPIQSTWDQWETAAGDTWEDVETNIQTWDDSQTAGVELE